MRAGEENSDGCCQTKEQPRAHWKSKKGDVVAKSHGRNCESCEFAEVTRTELGTYASRRASENAGAELLGGSHQRD